MSRATRSGSGSCRPTPGTATRRGASPRTSPPTPPLALVWLGRGFAGDGPAAFPRARGVTPEIVGERGRRGFRVEPRRWKVEQTFGCPQRYRRPRVDDEASLDTSRAMTMLASLFMTGMRLERTLPT